MSTIPLVSTRHAACSCEQLRLTVEGEPVRVSICHCLACQRRTGSVFGVQARFDAEQVTTEGASRQYIRVSDEGEKRASFHFCPGCGATVFYTTEATPRMWPSPWARSRILPSLRRRGRTGRSGDIRGCGFQTRSIRELSGAEVARPARVFADDARARYRRSWSSRFETAAEGEWMITLDHVGFAVADYERSKAFYEKALAPLGLKLLM